MRTIPDISHYQSVDWNKFKPEILIQKCTESTSYVDPTFAENKKEAVKRGILFGAYHFCRGGDAVGEAEYFLKNAGDCDFYACDWEINHDKPVAWCRAFCDRVALSGKPVLIYLNEATVNDYDWTPLTQYPLWVAKYWRNDGSVGIEPKIGKWGEWTLWQYTSNGAIDGISGRVDLNLVKDNFLKIPMNKDFVEQVAFSCGKRKDFFGDNINEKEQKDAAERLKDFREEKEVTVNATEKERDSAIESLRVKTSQIEVLKENLKQCVDEKQTTEQNTEATLGVDDYSIKQLAGALVRKLIK